MHARQQSITPEENKREKYTFSEATDKYNVYNQVNRNS